MVTYFNVAEGVGIKSVGVSLSLLENTKKEITKQALISYLTQIYEKFGAKRNSTLLAVPPPAANKRESLRLFYKSYKVRMVKCERKKNNNIDFSNIFSYLNKNKKNWKVNFQNMTQNWLKITIQIQIQMQIIM